MEKYPHLRFIQKVEGKPRIHGGGGANPISKFNRENRELHSIFLSNKISQIQSDWKKNLSKRKMLDLPDIESGVVPIILKVNPDLLNNSQLNLKSFDLEIISTEEKDDEGIILGASLDNVNTLTEKINGFATKEHGSGKVADFWEIIDGNRNNWKRDHILSLELNEKWNKIKDTDIFQVEVGIAFDKPLGKKPDHNKKGGEDKLRKYQIDIGKRDMMGWERQDHFQKFISHYGIMLSSFVSLGDSFACEVEISGKGLKDLVENYPFVFEVNEIEEIHGVQGGIPDMSDPEKLEILPPDQDAPEIGIIDSGIMEGNKYISLAINPQNSQSFLKDDSATADQVKGGGHGTKVAGAILYPKGISGISSPYKLPCYVRNLRILDKDNKLLNQFPAELMERIVLDNTDCRIFNLSVNSDCPSRRKHMSSWAAMIDSLIHEKQVLFVISSGNINKRIIQSYLSDGKDYPDYLIEKSCRIANPGQSSFALVVGSINHTSFKNDNWESLGQEEDISAFSRIGPGIWGKVKPDVVEFGGGLVVSKNGLNLVTNKPETAPELIRSTLHGGRAIGKDASGTSFAAPKVSHIAAQLLKLYPNEGINIIRALIVQGARLPQEYFYNPNENILRKYGYGIPSLERITKNSEQRITFYNTNSLTQDEGHIYSLSIPQELRSQANEYEILIEVTLAYTAKVRRTRQGTKSYLSTWLDWRSSKLDDESLEMFKTRALKEIDGAKYEEYEKAKDKNSINWKIRNNTKWGSIKGFKRSNSTVQKDWAIIKSYELPEEISFCLNAHKGWDKNKTQVPYAFVVSIEILNENVPIYERIKIENEVEIEINN